MTQRLMTGQVLFALALAALNTVYAAQVLLMDRPFANGEPGPAFLPSILCIFVYFAIARLLFTELRDVAQERETAAKSEAIANIHIVGPFVAIGLTALFIVGFFYAGYLVSAAIYTFLIALYFNFERTAKLKRSSLIAAMTAIGVTLFGWLFFVKLFGLYLPIWEF